MDGKAKYMHQKGTLSWAEKGEGGGGSKVREITPASLEKFKS